MSLDAIEKGTFGDFLYEQNVDEWDSLSDLLAGYTEYLASLAEPELERLACAWATKTRLDFQQKRKALKAALEDRDGRLCSFCGAEKDLTVDHKTPVSAGGTNDLSNLLILCRVCNSKKGNRPYLQGGSLDD